MFLGWPFTPGMLVAPDSRGISKMHFEYEDLSSSPSSFKNFSEPS
jgi:hypothetical protein